jgi:hypothetical protein
MTDDWENCIHPEALKRSIDSTEAVRLFAYEIRTSFGANSWPSLMRLVWRYVLGNETVVGAPSPEGAWGRQPVIGFS